MESMVVLHEAVIKLAIAAAIGLIIGLERRAADKPVGQRTLAMICIGACLAAIASQRFQMEAARMLAGIITGIGFLGAGAIMSKGSADVKGLTTATTIWAVAIIGMIVGIGEIWLGLIASGFVLLMLRFNIVRGIFTGNYD